MRCHDLWLAKDNRFLNPMSSYSSVFKVSSSSCLAYPRVYHQEMEEEIVCLPNAKISSCSKIYYLSVLSSFLLAICIVNVLSLIDFKFILWIYHFLIFIDFYFYNLLLTGDIIIFLWSFIYNHIILFL